MSCSIKAVEQKKEEHNMIIYINVLYVENINKKSKMLKYNF